MVRRRRFYNAINYAGLSVLALVVVTLGAKVLLG